MVSAILIVVAIITAIAVGLGGAYYTGSLDDLIAPILKYVFKAKAKAQVAALKAQGKKEGEDFIEGELSGNKQANDVASEGLGGISKGLKGL